jgi:uncharacterized membrane protein YeaQ/YmgE (transglycosylase-associated protein family)
MEHPYTEVSQKQYFSKLHYYAKFATTLGLDVHAFIPAVYGSVIVLLIDEQDNLL